MLHCCQGFDQLILVPLTWFNAHRAVCDNGTVTFADLCNPLSHSLTLLQYLHFLCLLSLLPEEQPAYFSPLLSPEVFLNLCLSWYFWQLYLGIIWVFCADTAAEKLWPCCCGVWPLLTALLRNSSVSSCPCGCTFCHPLMLLHHTQGCHALTRHLKPADQVILQLQGLEGNIVLLKTGYAVSKLWS